MAFSASPAPNVVMDPYGPAALQGPSTVDSFAKASGLSNEVTMPYKAESITQPSTTETGLNAHGLTMASKDTSDVVETDPDESRSIKRRRITLAEEEERQGEMTRKSNNEPRRLARVF